MRFLIVAVLAFLIGSANAQLRDTFGVAVENPKTQQYVDEARSRGMSSPERWMHLKTLDAEIKDTMVLEARERSAGNTAKANILKLKIEMLREKRAIYAKAPD